MHFDPPADITNVTASEILDTDRDRIPAWPVAIAASSRITTSRTTN